MKELVLKNGSVMPFWLKDLDYLQRGFAEAVGAVVQGLSFSKKNFVISGCRVTDNGTKVSMTPGWCYYEGEILPVRALSATSYKGNSPKVKFAKVELYDHEGDRTVSLSANSGMTQVYRDSYLEPSVANEGETYVLAISEGAWNLGERIAAAAKVTDTTVQLRLNAYSGNIQYRKVGGVVQLLGYVWNDAAGAGIHNVIANGLPRPSTDLFLNTESGSFTIGSNGVLSVESPNDKVYLNQIVYLSLPTFSEDDGHHSSIDQSDTGGSAS